MKKKCFRFRMNIIELKFFYIMAAGRRDQLSQLFTSR